jgi:hypothetical protein
VAVRLREAVVDALRIDQVEGLGGAREGQEAEEGREKGRRAPRKSRLQNRVPRLCLQPKEYRKSL